MDKLKYPTQAQGQLITAAAMGGAEALWRMAGREGPAGELARMALEVMTAPNSSFSAVEAVSCILENFRDRHD